MKTTTKIALAALALGATGVAVAGTGASANDFAAVVTLLQDWATGTLGKVISLSMFIVGLAAGITKQSVMAVVAGVGGALVLTYGPTVINNMFTALV